MTTKRVKDTELYDVLGVQPECTEIELKKAYRKKAIQFHPDKNPSPEAEEKFKEVGEAYQILSNADSRAFYDKVGRAGMTKEAGEMADPQEVFSKIFGGEAFYDYIGEISLIKDFTSTMDAVMTPEEKAAMEAAAEAEARGEDPQAAAEKVTGESISDTAPAAGTTPAGTASVAAAAATGASVEPGTSLAHHSSFSSGSGSGSTAAGSSGSVQKEGSGMPSVPAAAKSKAKLSPEQKAQLDALEKKRDEEKEKRIEELKQKLIQRIRPFVEAKNPGHAEDSETKAFEARIRTEAEDLKLESFGIELLHTISTVYITKSANFVKSKKFFGGGFFGRLKEKGGLMKEGFGLLGSALSVQTAMEEMERLEQKGDATQEEIEALAQELSSKMLLTTWRATRWEVVNVVGAAVEAVLYEPNISKDVSLRRAKAIMSIGGIFKSIEADESDDERRELERLVMEAGNKKKKAEKEKEKEKAKAGSGWFGRGPGHAAEGGAAPAAATTATTTPAAAATGSAAGDAKPAPLAGKTA